MVTIGIEHIYSSQARQPLLIYAMSRSISTTLLLVCFFFALPALAQEKVYMPFFEVINMNQGYQYATSKLLKSYLTEDGRYDLVLPAKTDSNYSEASPDITKAMAVEVGAKYYLTGELNRIGETVIVTINMYTTVDGARVWFDKMKANSPDDLDPIMQRFAKHLGTDKKAGADGDDIYSVTAYDAKALKKVQSNFYYGFSIGAVGWAVSIPKEVLSGLGVSTTYDTRKLLIDLTGQAYWGDKSSVYMASIETYYAYKDQKTTPFIGGGLALANTAVIERVVYNSPYSSYESSNRLSNGGLMLLAGGGYLFNRTGNVALRVTGNAIFGLYEVNSEPSYSSFNSTTSSNAPYSVVGALIKLQVLFQ